MEKPTTRCAKLLFFRAEPHRIDAYSAYLRETVEPIDAGAQAEGALASHQTIVDPAGSQGWTHMRIFFFVDEPQRARVKEVFARIAAGLEPDAEKRARRKAEGERLRTLVAELDLPQLD